MPKRIEEHLEHAELCLRRGDRPGAVRHYQAILALWEPSPEVSSECLEAVRELVRPVRPVCDYQVGEYYREIGQLDLALHHLRRSDDFAPQRWQTYVALGRTYFARGDFRNALGYFQETQRLVHGEPDGLTPEAELASAAVYEHIAEILLRNRPDGQTLVPFFEAARELYQKAGDLEAAERCRLRLWRQPTES